MSKSISSHTLQLVTFTTATPFAEVIARLDKEVGKGPKPGMAALVGATSKDDFEKRVGEAIGPSGFMYFNDVNHSTWLQLYTKAPGLVVYVIGNPQIAATVLEHDVRAAYNMPPRLLVIDKANEGTEVVYHLPSSVMALGDKAEVKAAAEAIDSKLEALAAKITA
ncbi:hypothetical protein C8R46DRAFT_628750 [Mycena filopes]|nr:hypothetical protein C8R46DRAFT_628750 [Mycena filopes]